MTPKRFALYAFVALVALCLALAVLFLVRDASAAPACTHTVSRSQSSLGSVPPGSVVCLEAGQHVALTVTGVMGTAAAPVTIINAAGVATFPNITIKRSERLRLTGSGAESHCGAPFSESDQRCGIVVVGSSAQGISGIEGTRWIEIDHANVRSGEAAINVKSPTMPGSWILERPLIHHNYLHDITSGDRGGAEALYLGMSDWHDGGHAVRDADVWANLTARTGWEGLQVGGAISGCRVRDNVVLDHSLAEESGQMSGITIKSGSVCDVVGNRISGGSLHGIFDYGSGGSIVGNCIERVDSDGINIRQTPGTSVKRRMTIVDNRVNGQGGAVVGGTSNLSADSVVARNGLGACTGGPASTPTPSATPTATAMPTVTATRSPTSTPPIPTATASPTATSVGVECGGTQSLCDALNANGDTAASDEMRSVLGASGRLYVQIGDGAVVTAEP